MRVGEKVAMKVEDRSWICWEEKSEVGEEFAVITLIPCGNLEGKGSLK